MTSDKLAPSRHLDKCAASLIVELQNGARDGPLALANRRQIADDLDILMLSELPLARAPNICRASVIDLACSSFVHLEIEFASCTSFDQFPLGLAQFSLGLFGRISRLSSESIRSESRNFFLSLSQPFWNWPTN